MNVVPPALDFLNNATVLDTRTFERIMIEFAKAHVLVALTKVRENYRLIIENEELEETRELPNKSYRINDEHRVIVDELSILASYDLDDIW